MRLKAGHPCTNPARLTLAAQCRLIAFRPASRPQLAKPEGRIRHLTRRPRPVREQEIERFTSQSGDDRVVPGASSSTGGTMTAAISAREPLSSAVSDVPGCRQRPETDEWQLVSEASHELRTPLTALRTELELAFVGNRHASELRAALRSAADEIRRMCRLEGDILLLGRAEHRPLLL